MAPMPSLSVGARAISVISVSMMVVSSGRMVKRNAPVTLSESRSAYIVSVFDAGVGFSIQNSRNSGNSSPGSSPVRIARPRAVTPKF